MLMLAKATLSTLSKGLSLSLASRAGSLVVGVPLHRTYSIFPAGRAKIASDTTAWAVAAAKKKLAAQDVMSVLRATARLAKENPHVRESHLNSSLTHSTISSLAFYVTIWTSSTVLAS
jgi:hypothetical protein